MSMLKERDAVARDYLERKQREREREFKNADEEYAAIKLALVLFLGVLAFSAVVFNFL